MNQPFLNLRYFVARFLFRLAIRIDPFATGKVRYSTADGRFFEAPMFEVRQ